METNKSKLLWIAVLGLLILNFGTLAFIWLHHGRGGHEPPHGNVAGFIIHELNFSDEQIKKFDLLKESHHQQIENTQHHLHDLHKQFFDLLKSDTPYSTKAKSIAEEIAASQKEIETATWNHFSEVRKICDAKQKEKFDDIVDDILRMMAPPPHGEHHP